MARAHISLPEGKLQTIDDWADEHGFNRSEAIGVMADIVAGDLAVSFEHPDADSNAESTGTSTTTSKPESVGEIPDVLSVEEAQEKWEIAKQGSDTRLDILVAAINGEKELFTREELRDLVRGVSTPATPGYERTYIDQLESRGDLAVSPLLSGTWVSDDDVERKMTQLCDQIGEPYTDLDVEDREDLSDHLGIDLDTRVYALREYEVALWAQAWQEIMNATGGQAEDWLGKWAIEEFVGAVTARAEGNQGFAEVRKAIRNDIGR